MSTTSWTQVVDNAAKLMIFNRFAPILGVADFKNDLVFAPRENNVAFRMISEKRGAGTVEFISVWSAPAQLEWARQNTPASRRGIEMEYKTSAKTETIIVKATPAVLEYKFCVYSLDLDKLKLIVESYIRWLHDHPNLKIRYSGLYEMDMYLKFGQPADVTDYNIYEKGKYFIYEFPLTIDGWVLTSFVTKTIMQIILDVYLREGEAPNYRDTLIDEYIITADS